MTGEDVLIPSTLASITPTDGGTVSLPDGSASVFFPEDFFNNPIIPDEVFVSIVKVNEASIPPPSGESQLLGDVFDVTAFDAEGNSLTEFEKTLELTFRYDPDLVILKGLIEEDLVIRYYDQVVVGWVPILSVVDTGQHTVTGYTDHFTLFGVFGAEPVPEPTTFILLGTGFIGLLVIMRKRFKKRAK
ncbi:MAG: PEP-CTERM sorting domain-containing protein [bacterium]|nr:PEP-CTERM sorting domain-containing protein [bacterium]